MRHLTILLTLTLISACAATSDGLDHLDRELNRLERQGMVGHVLVAREGELLYSRGVGTVSPASGAKVSELTVFPLLSLTKTFTAGAILQLAATGHFSLDDPVGQHVPGLSSPWADIPIHALLSHSSGLSPQITTREWTEEPRLEPITAAILLSRLQLFPPRDAEEFRYSNVGYGLLAVLIESVSGMSYEAYLQQAQLAPADLDGIAFHPPPWPLSAVVTGRLSGKPYWRYVDQPMLADGAGFNLRANGELHASASDILRWWQLLSTGAWLPEGWMPLWLTPRVEEGDGTRYGYGWQFRETRWGQVIGHTGGDGVYATDFSWYRDQDLLIYIATADDRFQADLVRRRLHSRLLDGGFDQASAD